MTPAEQIRELLKEAYSLAQKAHEKSYRNVDTNSAPSRSAVMSYLCASISKYNAAAAIYWAHPELEDEKFIKLLNQFDRVTAEGKQFCKEFNNATGFLMELTYLESMLEE